VISAKFIDKEVICSIIYFVHLFFTDVLAWRRRQHHHHHHLGLLRFRILTSEFMNLFLDICRTPWTGDQPDARPQGNATHKNADTSIHGPSGIRTHDTNVRAAEDSTCLRSHSHWDRHL